jgi:hypothetical protein
VFSELKDSDSTRGKCLNGGCAEWEQQDNSAFPETFAWRTSFGLLSFLYKIQEIHVLEND